MPRSSFRSTLVINGVLQKLNIIEHNDTRLVLREYPLGEWLGVLALLLTSVNTIFWGFELTAIVAVAAAVVVGARANIRRITFDISDNHMTIHMRSPLRRHMVNQIPLQQIEKAYLSTSKTDHTQIVLVRTTGDEMGLSVYSRDVRPWKDDIVRAINAILQQASHPHSEDSLV